jgi:DNA polymerase III delta prime subunit
MPQEVSYWEVNSWFWEEITERKNRGKNFVGLIVGPPGIGKTLLGIAIRRELEKIWEVPSFPSPVCVFNPSQFWAFMRDSPRFAVCPWDEPNKGLSHRKWYDEMNQAVVTYIQTMRFKDKNLLLMLPSSKLVDKSARAVCTFEIIMKEPGLGRLHQLIQNNFGSTPEFWKQFRGEIQLKMPDRSDIAKYNDEKETFHKSDFPEEAFQETSEPRMEDLRGWKRVYALVKKEPEKYMIPNPRNPLEKHLSARTISALLDCSDNTARKVVTKIEFENRITPV